MIATYTMPVIATCPVNGQQDVYELFVSSEKPVLVEDIIAAVKAKTAEPILQERLAEELAARLKCGVYLVGYHSGVKVAVYA